MSNNNGSFNNGINNGTTNSRWSRPEELSLIKDISSGINLEILSQKHNRSVSAIELRLKKIIYENANDGKSLNSIAQLLRMDINKVNQYYYSYKEFKEKQSGGTQQNLTNPATQIIGQAIQTAQTIQQQTIPPVQQTHYAQPQFQTNYVGGNNSQFMDTQINAPNLLNVDKAFGEPSNSDKLESKLKRLEMENKILRLVVENKELTHQLNKLIKEGKVDPSIKTVIKSLRKTI